MKAIILAAGEWTRLRPLTNTLPKPMLKIFWKTILEYNLESIYKYVDEIIIVVKYKKEKIQEYLWNNYKWVKIVYKEQGDEKGTWSAIRWIDSDTDVLIMNWDSIFDKNDIEELITDPWYWALVQIVDSPEKYWIFSVDNSWYIKEIIEKPKTFVWNLANLWVYKFSPKIFEFAEKISLSPRNEYEITDAINEFAKIFPFKAFEIKWEFYDISYPEDIEKTEEKFKNKLLIKPEIGTATLLEEIWDFNLYLWIDKKFIDDLIKYSSNTKDIALLNNTWDLKRFSSIENFQKWYNDDWRYIFTLTSNNKLAWIWWWRPSKLPNISKITNEKIAKEVIENEKESHTSWIRIYPDFRWKWLAKIILQRCSFFYRKIIPNAYICVDVDKENIPSQKAYEKNSYIFFWYWENKKTVKSQEKPRLLYVERPINWYDSI